MRETGSGEGTTAEDREKRRGREETTGREAEQGRKDGREGENLEGKGWKGGKREEAKGPETERKRRETSGGEKKGRKQM